MADAKTINGYNVKDAAAREAITNLDTVKLASSGGASDSIRFGVDSEGNYGYYKAGADTVTPFKSNSEMSLYGTSNAYFAGVGTVTTSQNNIPAGTYIAIAIGGGLGVGTTYPSLSATNGTVTLLNSVGSGYSHGARTRIYSVTMTSNGTLTASFYNNSSEDRTDVQLIIFQ